MHAATVTRPASIAVDDDPHADTGLAYLRAATWLLATAHGYGEAMRRHDYMTAALWHRARQRAERHERAAWAAFAASRLDDESEA